MTVWRSDSYQEDVARVANMAIDWTQFQAATVLLSGASGMIGSFLVDVLMVRNRDHATNCTVKAVARNAAAMRQRFAHWAGDEHLKLIPADVCSGGLRGESADFVIHAAGNTHPVAYATDPVGTIMTNVQGTYAMLDLAVAARARRFVFVSTVEIYGENSAGERPFREDDMGYIDCNTLRAGYPESKRAGEALCQA
ncbi:MAG: NAD-dependent epimerase/dehydratase family protein, partial [Micrococcales bacterium]|nr:NAD-dependent epimerase/dehydratase family protein [Micrococcales bacterium]